MPWKGRHKARCFNPKKPFKFHFKKFMLTDAETGYNFNCYWYGGASETRPEGVSATTWPVQHLLSSTTVPLCHKNHVVALDNWFTSSHTFEWLSSNGFVGVGTVGPGKLGKEGKPSKPKPGFPLAGIFKKTKTRTRAAYVVYRGKMQKGTGSAADCWVTAWQDRNPVHVLSTYPPVVGLCQRKVKIAGQLVTATYPRPSVVHHYNNTMGGTDLHDQRVANFRTVVKSKRWQVRVLTDTFTSMVQNAFILYKQYHGKGKGYSSLQFIQDALNELADLTSVDESSESDCERHFGPARKLNEHRRSYWIGEEGSAFRLKGRNHWPKDARDDYATVNAATGKANDVRRKCMWNPELCDRTYYYCECCMVALCIAHFELFHTAQSHQFPVCTPG